MPLLSFLFRGKSQRFSQSRRNRRHPRPQRRPRGLLELKLRRCIGAAREISKRPFHEASRFGHGALRMSVKSAEDTAALQRFRGFFNLNQLARGMEIVFSCDSDGRLNTAVDRQARPEIRSRDLCWALSVRGHIVLRPERLGGRERRLSIYPSAETLSEAATRHPLTPLRGLPFQNSAWC